MKRIEDLSIEIYADCADPVQGVQLAKNPLVKGFTTNPTLMRKAGIVDYEKFARAMLDEAGERRPVSFEVFADDWASMIREGKRIATWGENAVVKVPITDTRGIFCGPVIGELSAHVTVNITGIFTHDQLVAAKEALDPAAIAIFSVFAGRIADTGRDPVPIMEACRRELFNNEQLLLLWASPREVLNIFQADEAHCDIITCTPDLIAKLPLVGKNLDEYSLETVRMFNRDALAAGFSL